MAAAFAALSGPHVAFSRMALTDASFLLFWVLALIQGQRFLERPGAVRAVLLGLAVGAAQLFKYNGWLAGVIVVLSAAVWLVVHPARVAVPAHGRDLGLGPRRGTRRGHRLLALVRVRRIARRLRRLLAHQRGYLGGFRPGRAISRSSSRRREPFPAGRSGSPRPVSPRRPRF